MLTLFWLVFWVGLSALAFAAAVSLRVRLNQDADGVGPVVDDEALRAIMDTGTLTTDEDEASDLREIDQEERRFWSEDWEEPEEW